MEERLPSWSICSGFFSLQTLGEFGRVRPVVDMSVFRPLGVHTAAARDAALANKSREGEGRARWQGNGRRWLGPTMAARLLHL